MSVDLGRLKVGDRVRHIRTGWCGTVTREPYSVEHPAEHQHPPIFAVALRVQWDGYIEPMRMLAKNVERI